MRIAALSLVAILVLAPAVLAQRPTTPNKPPPSQAPDQAPEALARTSPIIGGVSIGEGAPDFELSSSRRHPVRLSQLRGDWVLLAFGDRWSHVKGLREVEGKLRESGVQVAAVCRERAGKLRSIARRDSMSMILLADVTGQVSAMYGLYDHARSQIVPGFLMIDRKGIVRMAVAGQLLPPEEVLRLARFAVTGL